MTSTDRDQWFATPLNVAAKLKVRRARKQYGAGEVAATRVYAWRCALQDLATQSRRKGQFNTDVVSFVEYITGTHVEDTDEWVADAARLWRVLEQQGIVDITGDPESREPFTVLVGDFYEVNVTPSRASRKPMTDAERARKYRERKRDAESATNPDQAAGSSRNDTQSRPPTIPNHTFKPAEAEAGNEVRQAAHIIAKSIDQDPDLWIETLEVQASALKHIAPDVWVDAAAEFAHQQKTDGKVRSLSRALAVFRPILLRAHNQRRQSTISADAGSRTIDEQLAAAGYGASR